MSDNNDPPVCCDVIDNDIIHRWFEYWEEEDAKKSGRCGEMIRKLRRLTLAGAKKGRRNNADVTELVAGILQGIADDLRAGNIKIQ